MQETKEEVIIIKSSGKEALFKDENILSALEKAGVPSKYGDPILSSVKERLYDRVPTSQIRKWVIEELNKIDKEYAKGFKFKKSDVQVTGGYTISQLKNVYEPFTKQRITDSLILETKMPQDLAEEIANKTSNFLIENNVKNVSGPIIREIVNYIMLQEGLDKYRARYQKIGMPVYDITQLINIGSKENANQQYNPETIHKLIADNISRRYSLTYVLPKKLASAHLRGQIHIHDLDYFPTRPFCFSHDLRFFLRNGLKADGTGLHTALAGPAKTATVAVLHAAKVLASGQVNCAGGQGFNWFNVLLAPYLKGLSYKEIKQLAQMFVYEMSMMYVSRGGQVVFSSIDIEPGIPKTLANIPAVQPGGRFDERVTYSDYHDEANKFFNALTEVYTEGDYMGKPFSFPKYELKIDKKDFDRYPDEMHKVSELAAKFGTPYYFIQQDYLPEYACYQCCAYLMPLSDQNSQSDLYNGTVRGGAMQVVCLNLPQIAYEAKGNDEKLFELLRQRMETAKEVHLLKHSIVTKRMEQGLLPFLSQPINKEKEPYFIPDKQGMEIGMVGLNEMLKIHTGKELHEGDESWKFGLKTITAMKKISAEFRNETGFMFGTSRVPAESASYRLARIDARQYPNAVFQGDLESDSIYYTNSTHIRPSANVSIIERLQKEGSFHPLLDGGAMSHIWLGEGNPDPEAITKLTKRIATNTLMSYFAYTRDLTLCNNCLHTVGGMLNECPNCHSKNIDWFSRITGYYQKVSNWNKGKIQELKERTRYSI